METWSNGRPGAGHNSCLRYFRHNSHEDCVVPQGCVAQHLRQDGFSKRIVAQRFHHQSLFLTFSSPSLTCSLMFSSSHSLPLTCLHPVNLLSSHDPLMLLSCSYLLIVFILCFHSLFSLSLSLSFSCSRTLNLIVSSFVVSCYRMFLILSLLFSFCGHLAYF